MATYTVDKGIRAVAFEGECLWSKENARHFTTRFTTTFSEDELVVHPNRLEESPSDPVEIVRTAYGIAGYFAFRQNGWYVLTCAEDVWVEENQEVHREEIKNGTKAQGPGRGPYQATMQDQLGEPSKRKN